MYTAYLGWQQWMEPSSRQVELTRAVLLALASVSRSRPSVVQPETRFDDGAGFVLRAIFLKVQAFVVVFDQVRDATPRQSLTSYAAALA
jgi:hypothetical protein